MEATGRSSVSVSDCAAGGAGRKSREVTVPTTVNATTVTVSGNRPQVQVPLTNSVTLLPLGDRTLSQSALQNCIADQLRKAGIPVPSNIVSLTSASQPVRQQRSVQASGVIHPTTNQRPIVVNHCVAQKKLKFKVRLMTSAKTYETYILQDVQKSDIATPVQLRSEMHRQFGELVSSDLDFGIGYMNGNLKVTIHSAADIDDVWKMCAQKGDGIVLWCEKKKKRVVSSDNDSDEDVRRKPKKKRRKSSALEEKHNRVEALVETLRNKHHDKFTMMQFRLWAKVLDGGTWKLSLRAFRTLAICLTIVLRHRRKGVNYVSLAGNNALHFVIMIEETAIVLLQH